MSALYDDRCGSGIGKYFFLELVVLKGEALPVKVCVLLDPRGKVVQCVYVVDVIFQASYVV